MIDSWSYSQEYHPRLSFDCLSIISYLLRVVWFGHLEWYKLIFWPSRIWNRLWTMIKRTKAEIKIVHRHVRKATELSAKSNYKAPGTLSTCLFCPMNKSSMTWVSKRGWHVYVQCLQEEIYKKAWMKFRSFVCVGDCKSSQVTLTH